MFVTNKIFTHNKVFTFCLILLLALASCTQSKIPSTDTEKVVWLSKNALHVRSISPSDEDFSDLYPLEKTIGNARIVMLGEQSHGDGSTFLAKTRLIKFLHQEMGFDVLAVESGLYDCAKAWELLQTGEKADFAIQQGVFQIWTQSEQVQPLINYISEVASSEHPLELTGFDSQFTGNNSVIYLTTDLNEFLAAQDISTSQANWTDFTTILQNLTQNAYQLGRKPVPNVDQQDAFLNTSHALRAEILSRTEPDDSAAAFWLQMLESIETNAKQKWQIGLTRSDEENAFPDPSVYQMRDIQMGRNLIWLANERYPNRKIIVWAATFHNARNLDQIETTDPELQELFDQVSVMGDVVWEALGDQIYSLGFTAYSGTAGTVWQPPEELEKSSEGSLEDLINRADLEYAIVDFRHPPPGGEWLQDRIVSRPISYMEMTASWPITLDGMMFIRDMTPSTYFNE